MKNLKEWYLALEQAILFSLVVAYLMSFIFIFDEQMRNTEWMGLIWIAQFIILGLLLAKRSKQKGWVWPSRP
jgi:FtsH-binding integral membrane protein